MMLSFLCSICASRLAYKCVCLSVCVCACVYIYAALVFVQHLREASRLDMSVFVHVCCVRVRVCALHVCVCDRECVCERECVYGCENERVYARVR